jgi:hypothetical protein
MDYPLRAPKGKQIEGILNRKAANHTKVNSHT